MGYLTGKRIVLGVALLALVACESPGLEEACEEFGLCDPGPPVLEQVTLICDASPGSACTPESLEATATELLEHVVSIPYSRLQAWASHDPASGSPVVVAIDDAKAISRILDMDTSSPLFIYNITELPRLGLAGWRFILGPEDHDLKQRVSEFFRQLTKVTAPSGAREVFGPGSRACNRVVEGPGSTKEWRGDGRQS